jgi:hypothetical protein
VASGAAARPPAPRSASVADGAIVSREAGRRPFPTRAAWLAFVVGTPNGAEGARAYAALYPEADYDSWTTGGTTIAISRIVYR